MINFIKKLFEPKPDDFHVLISVDEFEPEEFIWCVEYKNRRKVLECQPFNDEQSAREVAFDWAFKHQCVCLDEERWPIFDFTPLHTDLELTFPPDVKWFNLEDK